VGLVLLRHPDLVVARVRVEGAHVLIAHGEINDLVDASHWKIVFWACLVEVCEVDTHFPLLILTSIGLASHSVWMTSRITLALSSFYTSSLAASFLSIDILYTFCLCGYFLGSIRIWCSMRSRLTPSEHVLVLLEKSEEGLFHLRAKRLGDPQSDPGTPPVVPPL
jgi:hypothetical protein